MPKQNTTKTSQAERDLDILPTPIIRIDKTYTITYINIAGAKTFGLNPQDVVGRKCHELFKTTHCNTSECLCRQAMATGMVHTGETIADAGGMNLPIRYTAAPVTDDNGEIVGALEFVLDITEQKAASDDADRKMALLDSIPTPVMAIDRDYNVTYMNNAGAGALGSSSEKLIGRKCYDLFNTAHCKTSECRCRQAMETRTVQTGETKARISGQELPIEYTGTPIFDEKGEVVGALEYVLDISERKAVLRDIIDVANGLADGNLSVRAQGSYTGDFLSLAEGLNVGLDAQQAVFNDISIIAERLSKNDLTAQADGEYKGDFHGLMTNLNKGLTAQHDAIVEVAQAVEQVTTAAGQIASTSQQVAEGASQQASSLEETSSSLEEMASMTRNNAENTRSAQGFAQESREAATTSSSSMEKMVAAMGKIKDAAESTAAIISDINEIAFQTNLLALNAAVEAARAGEAGRGFAVVAEEVRNLALRAKDAAKNTEELIKQSMGHAERGNQLSEDVHQNLSGIVDSVTKVTDIITEITVASDEQARGIEQLNIAVTEMDRVVQQNAANSEESSSAAEELARGARSLESLVNRFDTRNTNLMRPQRSIMPSHSVPDGDWKF